uniref:hypothetical protein n=1 Tax=Methylobacterium sp. B34 TaxID=95563 RepID=UPI001FCB61F3|nr:hypothetical protein [Methylobacterium sp. B34]
MEELRPAGSIEVFNLSEDEFSNPTHADFMKKAFVASGDRRFRVFPAPGFVDWMHDLWRFRLLSFRFPLWAMRFPNDRLFEAGYRHRYGMGFAHRRALEQIAQKSEDYQGD